MNSDFSERTSFPGEDGNILDTALHSTEKIEKIPGVFFAILLFALCLIPFWNHWIFALIFFGIILLDWGLIELLPFTGKSFGLVKPPVAMLFLLRFTFTFLPPYISFPFQVVGTILVIYSFWIEPHSIRVTRQKFHSQKLKGHQPIKVLHLGDLHIEKITNRELQLNKLIKELAPDLIVFSGDILNLSNRRDPESKAAARKLIQEWKAPQGVYFVLGSPAVDVQDFAPAILDQLPVVLLQDQKVMLQINENQIDLVGISCTQRPYIDGPKLKALVEDQKGNFQILLYHTPDLAPMAAKMGIDLQLSGHTHGGQIRLPFWGALVTGSLYGKRFEAGRYEIDQMTLYVTRGIGMEGAGAPRVRFLCPPEIILWELCGAQ
jgi:uncharacterized protein